MEEFLGKVFGFALLALAAWIFLPRTFYYGDNIMAYSLETSFCNDYNVCDVKQFYPPLKLRVDTQKSEVVWLDSDNDKMGVWTGCTIADKENWVCLYPEIRMVDGYLQSDSPNIQHPAGYIYRAYWLASFLPDLHKAKS